MQQINSSTTSQTMGRIDEYLRNVKLDRMSKMPTYLPGCGPEEDMFDAFDMHPNDMNFKVYVSGKDGSFSNEYFNERYWWKSKADIIHKDYIIDLKTSSDLDKFQYSSRTYNYDSQAYIYQRMFGKPMLFFVICKSTLRLGIFDCSSEFIRSGQNKVEQATEVYNKFFSDESSNDIHTYIHKQTL